MLTVMLTVKLTVKLTVRFAVSLTLRQRLVLRVRRGGRQIDRTVADFAVFEHCDSGERLEIEERVRFGGGSTEGSRRV